LFYVLSREIFPIGLPDQFAFLTTLRMDKKTLSSAWHILRIDDEQGNIQFGIHVDGNNNDVTMNVMNIHRRMMMVGFQQNKHYIGKV